MYIYIIIILAIVCCLMIANSLREKETFPSLERKANLLSLSNDIKEIKEFAEAKIDYLSDASFNKLLSRIQELSSDNIIYEDLLKNRIDSFCGKKNNV